MKTTENTCPIGAVQSAVISGQSVWLAYESGRQAKLTFYKEHVFRLYIDNDGVFAPHPVPREPDHDTLILCNELPYYEQAYGEIRPTLEESNACYVISTAAIKLCIEKANGQMVLKKANEDIIWQETEPISITETAAIQTLLTGENEYFYGGGHQNGRFSHKNKTINIKNESNWVDGGVASPSPFYLSSNGYGVMRHTWQDGVYRFQEHATFLHEEDRFDAFYFIGDSITEVLNEYTELTGKPVFLPKYAYYLGHADCFNRDSTDNEDGSTRLESLMADAAGMVDSYVANDMPFGWFLPNDGYGCGYGQTDSFEGDLQNLEEFVAYANKHYVKTGLWTQSEILPKDAAHPQKGERDITKEVGIAGTTAVKTDAAWVGNGYSMALKAVRQSFEGIEHNSDYRAFVVSLNGWAGTQRYASIWTGDETGGLWEYIRFQIPTYLGAGLSGQPNVGSDMDGIYGGKEPNINTRDFQWKAFTPILIDMDGWGTSVKVPWEFGEPYTSINRMYLKLKSQLLAYSYSIAWQSHQTAVPMVRPMLIEYPMDSYTYGTETRYQFMWGPSLLVAPVYNKKENDSQLRGDIYLPDENQVWIDYFSGERYQGGAVYHNYPIPLWKTPVFVKSGAIIPMSPVNNSPFLLDGTEDRFFDLYPDGDTCFTLYDDDGYSKEFKEHHKYTITELKSSCHNQQFHFEIAPADGAFDGMCKVRGTQLIINVTDRPIEVSLSIGNHQVLLKEASDYASCLTSENCCYYAEALDWNQYATEGSSFADEKLPSGSKLIIRTSAYDITTTSLVLDVKLAASEKITIEEQALHIPEGLAEDELLTSDSCAAIRWEEVPDADFYEVIKNGVIHTNIKSNCFEDNHVEAAQTCKYQVRSRTAGKTSAWSNEIAVTTKEDHYKDVPAHINASYTGEAHPYYMPECAMDHNDATFFTSRAGAAGQDIILDMELVYDIESFHYTPKEAKERGTILDMDILGSIDGLIYKPIKEHCTFTFAPEEIGYLTEKIVEFQSTEKIRYLKLHIHESIDDFVAAHALYPYKVPETNGQPAGDYNNDGLIDEGDLTFLQNYAGICQTDNVWSHVSNADVNFNGMIDAYDLVFLTSQLEGGIKTTEEGVDGQLICSASKSSIKAGEQVILTLEGKNLKNINAFSAELTLDTELFTLSNCESGACRISSAIAEPAEAASNMINFSARREEKGKTRLFMAFANKGEKKRLSGDCVLAQVQLKALKDVTFDPILTNCLLVGSDFSFQ